MRLAHALRQHNRRAMPMPLSIDAALGVHAQALSIKAERMELLANNLANADTPHYKARDIDFRAALDQARPDNGLKTTHSAHLPAAGSTAAEVKYRIPSQPSLDGNTVDRQVEQSAFAVTALKYQASLTLLGMRIAGLRSAIRGE
jgi:flagellar basal-body rod protein FlgB